MTERKNKQRYTTLKIKVGSLAAEIRIIKKEEQAVLARARYLDVRLRLTDGNAYSEAQVSRILRRAKILRRPKSCWESRAVMTDEARDSAIRAVKAFEGEYDGLRGHRLGIRSEARAAHLAYGFLRGTPFKAMEKHSYTRPPLDRCEYHVLKFSGRAETEQQLKQRFAEWVEPAADWKKPVERIPRASLN